MVWLCNTAKAVVIQATWTNRAILLLFLVLPRHQQWLFSKCIYMICSHCLRDRHHKTSLLTHVILWKIQVKPECFIKWVRPSWPWQNVTRLTQMIRVTQSGCNVVIAYTHLNPEKCIWHHNITMVINWSHLKCILLYIFVFSTFYPIIVQNSYHTCSWQNFIRK